MIRFSVRTIVISLIVLLLLLPGLSSAITPEQLGIPYGFPINGTGSTTINNTYIISEMNQTPNMTPGQSATITINHTFTLAAGASAFVTNIGTALNAIWDIGIPQGLQGIHGVNGTDGTNGANGTAATIAVNSTTTLVWDEPATVVNIGTVNAALLDFGIPMGAKGDPGINGANGINGTNGTSASVIVNATFTGLPNTNASVVNIGNITNVSLDFTIPQGLTGDTGAAGATGGAGGQILYFRHANSTDPITYEGLIPVPAGAAEVDESVTIKNTGGKTLVDAYITDVGYPAVTEYPAGLWRFRTFGYVNGASGTTTFIFDVYNRTSGGTETLLFTATSEDINALVPTEYLTSYVQTTAYPVALTDRIVVKVSVQTTHNANIIVHWVYEGSTHTSHIQTALSSASDSTLSFNIIAGETLYKGQAVYISGATGGNPVVMRADNLVTTSSRVVGLMADNTASGARGIVRRAGALTNVDTRNTNTNINPRGQTWVAGDLLFSTSTGGLTNIRPTSGRSVKAAYTLSGSSAADTLLAYPMENPVWITAAASEDIVLRMGDSGGINKVSFRNYTNSEIGWVLSNGTSSFTGSNYNASYLTSTYNATYDAKPDSTFNATYAAFTNYNASYWTGTNYNASYLTSTYNATYDAKTNYNSSYWTGTNYNATYDAKPTFSQIYPVGSIYISVVSTSPTTLFGFGTWVAFGTGRIPIGIDTSNTQFDIVKETGGSNVSTSVMNHTHVATVTDPTHAHVQGVNSASSGASVGYGYDESTSTSVSAGYSTANSSSFISVLNANTTGGVTSVSLMNPYIVVYMWERTG